METYHLKAATLYILVGTVFGALWAITLLGLGALVNDANTSPALIDVFARRTNIGLWFSSPAGALVGLIIVQSKRRRPVDEEGWPYLVRLTIFCLATVAIVITTFTALLAYMLPALEVQIQTIIQVAGTPIARVSFLLSVIVPAGLILWFVIHQSKINLHHHA